MAEHTQQMKERSDFPARIVDPTSSKAKAKVPPSLDEPDEFPRPLVKHAAHPKPKVPPSLEEPDEFPRPMVKHSIHPKPKGGASWSSKAPNKIHKVNINSAVDAATTEALAEEVAARLAVPDEVVVLRPSKLDVEPVPARDTEPAVSRKKKGREKNTLLAFG